jgi:hypothetical protein
LVAQARPLRTIIPMVMTAARTVSRVVTRRNEFRDSRRGGHV